MNNFKFRFNKPSLNEFTEIEFNKIKNERIEHEKNFKFNPLKTYCLNCRACNKPNKLDILKCSRCFFELTKNDLKEVSPNIFLDIIEYKYTKANVIYRDEEILIFEDEFPISKVHFDVIPIKVIIDISELNKSHLNLIKKMYHIGINEIKKRNLPFLKDKNNIENFIAAGFNYPVNVFHLHLVVPPFINDKVFTTLRFNRIEKVLNDLENFGKVKLFKDFPNEKENEINFKNILKIQKRKFNF
jgi:diadenosine tetraphosphate (Ap4A) HIT family hydrolase